MIVLTSTSYMFLFFFDRKFDSLSAVGPIGWVRKQPEEPAGTAAQSETSKPQAACLGFQVMMDALLG